MMFARVCWSAAALMLVGCDVLEVEKLCQDDRSGDYSCSDDKCLSGQTEVGSYGSFEDCSAAIAAAGSAASDGTGGDCAASCSSEFPRDIQLDSFCRAACCYAINGQTSYAEQTCQAGSVLGSDSCRYCP
jgi:hypothetical protein